MYGAERGAVDSAERQVVLGLSVRYEIAERQLLFAERQQLIADQ